MIEGTHAQSEDEQRWSALMRAANRGDAGAYAQLLRDLAELLRLITKAKLSRLGFPVSDAEDVVQETLIAIHRKRHTWDESRPFLPWLRAIAQHKLVDHARRARRGAEEPLGAAAANVAAPEPDSRAAVPLMRYVKALPGRQRQVVEALAIRGDSVRDAAARLDMKEGAVRVALHRGLATILARYGRES
jgi:RNA polymerase sigma-70 factor (ECF subfamily)